MSHIYINQNGRLHGIDVNLHDLDKLLHKTQRPITTKLIKRIIQNEFQKHDRNLGEANMNQEDQVNTNTTTLNTHIKYIPTLATNSTIINTTHTTKTRTYARKLWLHHKSAVVLSGVITILILVILCICVCIKCCSSIHRTCLNIKAKITRSKATSEGDFQIPTGKLSPATKLQVAHKLGGF